MAVLAADGFEQVELTRPLKQLLRQGAAVDIVSLHRGRIRGINLLSPGIKLRVTRTVDQVSAADYDALFIPGGFINPDFLRQSEKARVLVTAFDVAGKPIATLCHRGRQVRVTCPTSHSSATATGSPAGRRSTSSSSSGG